MKFKVGDKVIFHNEKKATVISDDCKVPIVEDYLIGFDCASGGHGAPGEKVDKKYQHYKDEERCWYVDEEDLEFDKEREKSKMSIAKEIKDYRERKGMTQKRFGDLVGISQISVFNWESGKCEPAGEHLKKVKEIIYGKSKYKVGDKVIVRKDLDLEENYNGSFANSYMVEQSGKTLTISDDWEDGKTYEVKENGWVWTDDMFEGLAKEDVKKEPKYKVGDRVKVKRNLKEGKGYEFYVNSHMTKLAGKTVTISSAFYSDCSYMIKECEGYWWGESMFEGLAKKESLFEKIKEISEDYNITEIVKVYNRLKKAKEEEYITEKEFKELFNKRVEEYEK